MQKFVRNGKDLKVEFINWIDTHRPDVYSYKRKSRERFIGYLDCIETKYYEQFRSSPFDKNINVKELRENIYKTEGGFYHFSEKDGNHMPRAILGEKNYLRFLEEKNQ